MKTLKAPDGHLSVSALGNQYPVVDGLIENLEDHEAAAIQAHDSRFTVHNDDEPVRPGATSAEMTRKECFAALKDMGVAASATLTTDQLRDIVKVERAKKPEAEPVKDAAKTAT